MIGRMKVSSKRLAVSSRKQESKSAHCSLLTAHFSKGFTLLELMIVMTIIVILAAIVMPLYQKSVQHAREATLRDDLYQMRKAIDQFQSDKTKLPQSLQALADEKYIREVPVDPFTGAKDWQEVTGEDSAALGGGSGVTDVHSSSGDVSSEGTPYSEW